jgi:hypothetical protein
MSEDPDLPKASYGRQVLRQARLSRNETAAIMVGDLVYEWQAQACGPPKWKKLVRPRGSQFPPWQMLSKKKGVLGPLFGKQRSELPRAGKNC